MESFAPLASICLALGCAVGGVANAVDVWNYESALQDPGFYHLVDESGNSVSEQLELFK